MEESKRQKQVAGLLNEEINPILIKLGLNMIEGGMVSISKVYVTPDLAEARVYFSFYQVPDNAAALKRLKDRAWEIKKELTQRIRHQLRIMPQLQFFEDDTLEYVFKMEQLFRQIEEERRENSPGADVKDN